MLDASSGIPGLETFLPVLWTETMRRGADLPVVVGYVTWRPAEIFGLAQRKGSLEPGKDADFAVFDARRPWKFDASRSHSSAKWSPFDGRDLAGRVEAAFVRGRQVAAEGEVVADPGYGIWLRRGA
jgi:dihydroorotase-like cyclic amidohydrolase